jgi:hypothetical protein
MNSPHVKRPFISSLLTPITEFEFEFVYSEIKIINSIKNYVKYRLFLNKN